MKTLAITLLTVLAAASLASAKSLPTTNLDKVYGSGSTGYVEGQQISLHPGVYKVGDEDSKLNGDDYLMVDKYVNDDSQVLAILVKQSTVRSEQTGIGHFYLGKKIKNGTSIMLSPVYIDVNGNLALESEMNQRAPVIEITLRNDASNFRYPYMLQGHNGALEGRLMGMRSVAKEGLKFTPWPVNNVFEGHCGDSALVVSGSTVAVHTNYHTQERFELLPLNGDGGKFAAMVTTQLDTMGEYMVSDSNVSKLAFFIRNVSGEENFIVATPTYNVGEYKFQFYGPQQRTFLDWLFPGAR